MSAPTLAKPTRRTREPAVVKPGQSTTARTRVRVQWLALGAALTVLAGTLVAWSLTRAADRVQVVSVARPVAAGDIIEADDLTTAAVAFDGVVQGLVPAASIDRVVGQVATIDLGAGVLLNIGMWAHDGDIAPDERTVGAVLRAGRFPNGLAHGSTALAIGVAPPTATATPTATAPPTAPPTATATATAPPTVTLTEGPFGGGTPVRVLDVDVAEDGALHVTLAVPADQAAAVASLSATLDLVLVGVPSGAAETAPATTPATTEIGGGS